MQYSSSSLSVLIAAVEGGAMIIGTQQCLITDTIYSQNTAQSSAGAIRVDSGNITISNSLITRNSAYGGRSALGGAVFFDEGCNSTFINTTVSHNTATGGLGGALYTNSDTYITGCTFDNNTAATGGAIRYGPSGTVVVNDTAYTKNAATNTGGAMQSSTKAIAAVVSDTVVFSGNTAFCCYAKAHATHSTTANSTCVDLAYQETQISECCAAGAYSDGEHCQLCTNELTCDNIIGAATSTVVLPSGVWRASTTSSKTYTCWNSDACVGGAASTSTDDYCAAGYKGPCK
jgi:predicted outer membrane repeat protein